MEDEKKPRLREDLQKSYIHSSPQPSGRPPVYKDQSKILTITDQIRPVKYSTTLPDTFIVERSPNRWAIERHGSVYSRSLKDFEYEPMPSNRTEEFIADTRFLFEDVLKILDELVENADQKSNN